jgi:VWFA-related protein
MRRYARRASIAFLFILILFGSVAAQSGRGSQRGGEAKKKTPSTEGVGDPPPSSSEEKMDAAAQQEAEVVKIETNLVTVPVIVSTRGGTYVPDIRKHEFTIYEDGIKQELVFFATVTEPFHVVLMIDTSASTQEKLAQIQRAATAFIDELQPADRVKLISFDDRVRDFGDFTSDRASLSSSLQLLRPGRGTKLYDAMDRALKSLDKIRGRKAIVIFTDGVDWHSDEKSHDDNFKAIEESGVILYPIRYDTRAEVERMARQQAQSGQIVDLGGIFGTGTTPPTFPGGTPVPTLPTNTIRLPGSVIISRDPGSAPPPTTGPDATSRSPDPRNDPNSSPQQRGIENVQAMLDAAYRWADSYLNDLALKSGGRLLRADTLGSLPQAFAQIAAELRTQYSLGYYPPPSSRDGKFHKIQVRTTRHGVAVRARPGYRATKVR